MGKESEKEDICLFMDVTESLCCTLETDTTP